MSRDTVDKDIVPLPGLSQADLPANVDRRAFAQRRVDFDTTVEAMALTAKDMNTRYRETSERGLAVSVVLCSARLASV